MIKKKIALLTLGGMLTFSVFAQNEVDALRYSMSELPVSGRSMGMGGAFGALGADLSSLFSNPAGLGVYRRRNLEFSLGMHDVMTESTYRNQSESDARSRFLLNSIGLVGHQSIENSDWKSVSWGFGHAKTNNFYQNIRIKGVSNGSSLMDQFAQQAAGTATANILDALPFTSGLAYETYAIDPADSLGSSYYRSSGVGDIMQDKAIQRTGNQSETSIGFGANYRDFLMLGMTINFQNVHFTEISSYSEKFTYDPANFLARYDYVEKLYSDGSGVGVKLGAIVLPTSWVRVGLAYHSPVRIGLTESYVAQMSSVERLGGDHSQSSPTLVTEYSIRTPSRWMASMAFIMNKAGVFTVDYEYANFERIKMNGSRSNSYNYSEENDAIREIYRATHRLRAGMEFRVMESIYLRGGVIYQQSPYIRGVGAITSPRMTYSAGLGYRSDYFFIDLAASYVSSKDYYYLYDPARVDAASITNNRVFGLISFGMRY